MECGQCSAVYQFIGGHLVNVLFGVVEDRQEKVMHMEVSEEEYERLKELYIQKFGGWETIDLEHTDYNGQIWW